MGENFLTFTDENGQEKTVEVLHYFTLPYNNKNYIVYTENRMDQNDNVEVLVSEVIEDEESATLEGITDENVWNEIKKVLVNTIKGVN